MAHKYRKRPNKSPREIVRRILVVTEGTRTEPQYVEGLNRFLRSKGATAHVKGVPVGQDPLRVVSKCIDIRDEAERKEKGFDHCVCLVDVDQHKTLSEAVQLAKQEEIHLLISNLKFEAWLRWHEEDKRAPLNSKQLDELVANLGLVKKKSLTQKFPFHAVHEACRIARSADPKMRPGRVGPNPSSAVPILIDLMNGI